MKQRLVKDWIMKLKNNVLCTRISQLIGGRIRRIMASNDTFFYTPHSNFIYTSGDSLALVT